MHRKHLGEINIGGLDTYIKMTHAHYYWWIKYWQFHPKTVNHQSLLFPTISSYTIYTLHVVIYLLCTHCSSCVYDMY